MPIRDLFVTIAVFISLPYILGKPYFGIYVWSWLGYMNPHRLSWGFAYDFPFAYIVALTTIVGMMFSREPKRIPRTPETVLLAIFILWMLVTSFFAFYQNLAWLQMEKVAKIQVMIFLTLILINTRERLNTLIWIIVISLGLYGVKGGIFTIVHGGVYHVMGPYGTFIGGNNEIALALIMTIPLMRYLQLNAEKTWIRHSLTAAMLLSSMAIIGSQSRGALLGAAAMGLFLWFKSRNKLFTSIMMVVAVVMVLAIMPKEWYDRMNTIKTYEQDASSRGRINAWWFAYNLAEVRITGGGFETFKGDLFEIYAPNPNDVHDAHSIYFEVLGEHGFVGLTLFLLLAFATWRTGMWVIKKTKHDPGKKYAGDLAAMTQVSILGYAVGGAFLGLAYFDLYYHLICIIVLNKVILLNEEAQAAAPQGEKTKMRNMVFKLRKPQTTSGLAPKK